MRQDIEYMSVALEEARRAAEIGEIPVGAIVVNKDGEIIARAHNLREKTKSAMAHAEVLAIGSACEKIGDWRLLGCTLYVTLEPCPMCAGALLNSRIERVVFGAYDAAAGCLGSVINFNSYPFNHAFTVSGGVCEDEAVAILKGFFEGKRQQRKSE